MASMLSVIKCPNCGHSAVEDDYYDIGERYAYCDHCGYNYTKTTKEINGKFQLVEKEYKGYGVFKMVYKSGNKTLNMLNDPITDESFEKYKMTFMNDLNQEQSYLVSFENGLFTTLLGNPPKEFFLSFEEFREKELAKSVPIGWLG
ncbi:hypothetical protein [Lederbergia panacisoli]|uniref:hypothetical protein n=1 Tax=Lederbergia panacisoli TaxID=1255251 RepID=UPI00214B6BD0|nr:hypothetical protein [Lederbergia panacisoli]MCR2823670.1 hypothetical protein [Lederbergia panacisoli]